MKGGDPSSEIPKASMKRPKQAWLRGGKKDSRYAESRVESEFSNLLMPYANRIGSKQPRPLGEGEELMAMWSETDENGSEQAMP